MSIRKAIAMILALSGCGEVAQMSGAEGDPGCFGGDGGVCDEEVASAEEELSFGSRVDLRPRPVVRPGISNFWVNPPQGTSAIAELRGGDSRCVAGAMSATDPLQSFEAYFHAESVIPLQRVGLCRDGDCFATEEISGDLTAFSFYARDPQIRVFTPRLPLERVQYRGWATDRNGRSGSLVHEVKVGPRSEIELMDVVHVSGPRTGEGIRTFEAHWRGVNVDDVCLVGGWAPIDGTNWSGFVCRPVPLSDRWGPSEHVTQFEVELTAEQARYHFDSDFPAEWPPFFLQSRTALIDGCQGFGGVGFRRMIWDPDMPIGRPMETPMPPPDEPDPTPAPTPPWMPTCSWTCDTTSPAGWIRTDSRPTRLPDECPTPFQYQICRHDDRPVGNMLSVCSSERTPSNWNTLSFSSDAARCIVSTTGAAMANNVKLIQRRE